MADLYGHCVFVLLIVTLSSSGVLGQPERADSSKYAPPPGLFNRLEPPTNKTIDQLITEALGGIDVASNKILAPGSYVLAELDMYLSQEQFLRLYEPPSNHVIRGASGNIPRAPVPGPPGSPPLPPSSSFRQKRKAVRDVVLRWPDAQIPYQFARGDFSDKERYVIKQAMTEWERYTCIKFRAATSLDTNVVRFQNGEGCNSQLGMVRGVQLLNLDVVGCRYKGLYLHEMGHAMGLVHEHQLPDRDHYIDILMQNVAPHFRIFFNKYSSAVVNQFSVPYEYSSVMHYGITAFSYNGEAQTIRAKDQSKESSIGKVYLKELSFSDVKVVNEMYSCNAFCPDVVRCEGKGYLDQNCHCVCPDGSSDCEVRTDQPGSDDGGNDSDNSGKRGDDDRGGVAHSKGDGDERCENKYDNWMCSVWAKQGECERNPMYMGEHCTKACGQCDEQKRVQEAKNHFTTWAWQWFGMFTNLFPKDWMIGVCKDVYMFEKCQKWRHQGECVTNARWMENNCKMTCNFCGNPALRAETNCPNKLDDAKCRKRALNGECVLNEQWMRERCPRSCHVCVDMPDSGGQDEEVDVEEEDVTCFDKHDTVKCGQWQRVGECSKNPAWMIANCRRTCAKCADGTCKNMYDDTQCEVWAQEMECMKNREWMHNNCAKACGICDRNDSDTESRPDEDEDDKTIDEDDAGEDDSNNNGNGDDDGDDRRVTQRPRVVTRRPTVRTTQAPVLPPNTDTCYNTHNDLECSAWAKTGHCDINPQFMTSQCRKACGKCPKDGGGAQDEVCRDRNSGCAGWADHGFCESNPLYNLIYCKKACNNCNGCRDEQFLCRLWAKAGHCKTNAGYMLRQCQRACDTCH